MCRTGRFCRPFSLRSRSRSVAGPTLPAPWCCRRAALPAGQLPARCPTLPAGHSGSVAGPVVLPGQDRPHAPGPVVLPTCCAPGRLPTCCPWCCRPVNSRPVAPRSRPVTREALPAPWCCRRAALPAGHSGSLAGPSTLYYAAQLRRAGIAPYDRHMPRCPIVLTPSTGISPSDRLTPICISLEEV
jgi:hypothetical protein